mmetsp:Transcript_165098/g.524528  ORF Transcript_165098/g.524528 Transcript_165098/m.524528 type:complete len:302 (-) Transcript_165098:32-937(-)
MPSAVSAAAARPCGRRAAWPLLLPPPLPALILLPLLLQLGLPGPALGIASYPPDPADGVTQEMMDMEEHNRKQGYAMGVTGEYFRYKHLFWKQPSEKDRDEAIQVANKIRCDVCAAIVGALVRKAKSFSEDHLADVLEGGAEYERTGDAVHDRMLEHKKGCNKHFKDELIAEGFTLKSCKDVIPGRNDSEPCLFQDESQKPNEQSMDSYEMWKECLFYACEQTVSRFGDSLAQYLADALPGASDRTAVIRTGCELQARCLGRPAADSGSQGAPTAEKPEPGAGKKKGRRRRRRGGSKGGEL